MNERTTNPVNAPLITRPGESAEHVGTRNIVNFLPNIFQTTVNKQFLDATLEQLMASGSLMAINNYIGQRYKKYKSSDNYIVDNRDDNSQFIPGITNRDEQGNITQALSYDDLINSLQFNEVDINQHNKLLNEIGYTLDMPINYDMFINYHKYFWLVDVLPPCSIKPAVGNEIDIDDIVRVPYYTTPTLDTNNTLELMNGMRIRFMPSGINRLIQDTAGLTVFTFDPTYTNCSTCKVYLNNFLQTQGVDYTRVGNTITFTTAPAVGDEVELHMFCAYSSSGNYAVGDIYVVDGVGDEGRIRLTKQFTTGMVEGTYSTRNWLNHTIYSSQEPKGFDEDGTSFDFDPYDIREWRMTTRDYYVEKRYSADQSAWARSNLWIHQTAAEAVVAFENLDYNTYLADNFRAVRPIIELKDAIEKYDYGRNHIAYVNQLIEDTIDPATQIVGQVSYSHDTYNINNPWQSKGYNDGEKVYVSMGASTTYWECIKTHGDPLNPTHYENHVYWKRISVQNLEDGELVLFLRTTNSVYTNNIFRVGGVTAGTGITLTEVFGPNTTALNDLDKVAVLKGYNTLRWDDGEVNNPYSGSEWYWDGSAWIYGQQKRHRSEGIKVKLYDAQLTLLNDTQKYPDSNFAGDYIFNYGYDSSTKFDDALGFSPRYVDYGNTPGLSFDFGVGGKRYNYTLFNADTENSQTLEISGYYYYKNVNIERFFNNWSAVRGGQNVKRHVQRVVENASQNIVVDLGTTDYNKDNKFAFVLRNNLLTVDSENTSRINQIAGTLPTLFMSRNTTYQIETYFDESKLRFFSFDGSSIAADVVRVGTGINHFDLQINAPTYNAIKYYHTDFPDREGVIYFDDDTVTTNIKVTKNNEEFTAYTLNNNLLSITSGLTEGDVYDITYYSDSKLEGPAKDGHFLHADTHVYNPQNKILSEGSFGDLVAHMKDQMQNIPGFEGEYFGDNNYDMLPHVHQFGGTIRQQAFSTELLGQTSLDIDTDVFSALKFSAQQYRAFKSQFALKAQQLNNSLDISIPVHELVDRVLKDINVGKNADSSFANSNMAMYRDYESEDFYWTNSTTPVFTLPETINTYDDAKNHLQVWLLEDNGSGTDVWKSMINDVDYTLTETQITVNKTVVFPSSGQARIHVRWYPQNAVSFIPSSAVKLGLVRPYTPEIRSDYSLDSTSTATDNVIIGHDGSVHKRRGTELYNRAAAGFDAVDAALWDLELRIYNNLLSEFNNIWTYQSAMPNASRKSPNSWDDMTQALLPEYNKWKVRNNKLDFQSSTYFDVADYFTYNYKTVGPQIGGWRGLYTYYFNTDRPHTHPWEMLGHNTKPGWWDANYSWTVPAERTALIQALREGHYNDPADAVPKYSRDLAITRLIYDFDDGGNNILVTTTGVLNDPVTADLVPAPNVTFAAKDFEFGDWGPVEAEWRRSSEYKITQFVALMRTRPLWTINTFFTSNKRALLSEVGYDDTQWIYTNTQFLGDHTQPRLSSTKYEDSILESVRVVDGGSGYTSAPNITVYDNFGSGAEVTAFINNGTITGVSVNNPGKEYYNKPSLIANTGTPVLEAILGNDAKKYFIGLSNAIVEFAQYNNTTIDQLKERFENLDYNPMIKAGGFININNQKFVLESSQDKGSTVIPEENYSSILYTSKPNLEVFFGGVKITKDSGRFVVEGFDNSNQYFKYNKPIKSGPSVTVSEEIPMIRYKTFETTETVLSYRSTLNTEQDVYDFIHGYSNYLQTQGWQTDWRSVASQFVYWAAVDGTGTEITLMPDTQKIEIADGDRGYYDTLNNRYDGVYNIVGANGKQILPNRVLINRELMNTDNPKTSVQITDSEDSLYGLRLYKVEIEHAVVFDNSTNFDDVIYKPELGQLHTRIKWKGSRTKDWNGKLYSPGYLITDNTIVQNFDTTARELDQYYGSANALGNQSIVNVARFNSGYNKPDWATDLKLDDDTAFEFVKGTKKYRGTRFALEAFMRNNQLFGASSTAELYEQWAVRTADYGDIRSRDTVEFELTKDLLITSPQLVRFHEEEVNDVLTDITVDIDSNSNLLVTGSTVDVFDTRNPKTYSSTLLNIDEEKEFADDFITAGLPLTSETDYRVINRQDLFVFPEPAKEDYNFAGEWQNITNWDNRTAYKYNDKVLHKGRAWAMLDPDGTTGLTRPNDPIVVTGTVTLPTVPSSGETIIIDGTTVNLTKTSTSTNLNVINLVATNDIASTNVVAHGTTLILGESQSSAQTVTFDNVVTTITYPDIDKIGTVVNPTIQGSNSAELTIDGTTVVFNDTVGTTQNITAQAAFENAFNASWIQNTANISAEAVNRIAAWESLRLGFLGVQTSAQWVSFLNNYFSNSDSGLEISVLLTEYNTSPSYAAQLEGVITNDVTIINNILGTNFDAAQVIAGTQTITPAQISSAQSSLANGTFITDIKNWLVNNPGIPFTINTIVATQSGTTFQQYTLTDIVNKITSAGIPNITASADANRLKITKTTTTPSNPFSLTISAAVNNSDVGFGATTETINSNPQSTITTPNLTIVEVVNQINAAGITGITAQVNALNTTLLQINCNLDQLYVGTGTANSTIGLTTGITLAGTTTSQVAVVLTITDIITQINAAGITGVTANNSNNKLQLTSTQPTMVIGAGTANSTVGLTAQTYSATQTTIRNVFDALVDAQGNPSFIKMDNDPNIFSIWVADNSEQNNFNQGYAVFQTMDFGMHITNACAGITSTDNAQITIARQDGDIQAHNLQVGDYVFIRGSTTVPNIDGIHKVVDTDSSHIYIDEFIEQEGGTGNIYPMRNVRFPSYSALLNAATLQDSDTGMYYYNFSGIRQNQTHSPIYAFVDNDGTGVPGVYYWSGTWNDATGHTGGQWVLKRNGIRQAKTRLIENIKVYDAKRKSTIAQLETWDPAKGVVLGIIKDEIDFIVTADVATYNYNTIDGESTTTHAWGAAQVGKRWWNLNTSIWLDYEQGSDDYQQNNWGRLFDGSSIDVYEWTRSPVLPEQWQEAINSKTIVDGVAASGEVYYELIDGEAFYSWCEETYYNNSTKRTETYYYFWVKNKESFAGQRVYNTKQLAVLIEDPTAFDVSWAAASGKDLLLLGNVNKYITTDSVVQINRIYESNSNPLNEWTLISENDPDDVIPEYMHIKMRDSLAGFDNYRQRYSYTTWATVTAYSKDAVVQEGADYYISLTSNNQGNQPSLDTAQSYWSKIYNYTLPPETQQDDIDVWRGQMVPDLDLHPYNRYGHLVRPRQSLYRDLEQARQNWVDTVNRLLADIAVVNEVINWDSVFNYTFVEGTVTYSMKPYWSWVDWSVPTYQKGTVADKTLNDMTELLEIQSEPDGTYVYVRNIVHSDGINRPEMYYYENGTPTLVWKAKATVKLSEEMWNQSKFGHGFDATGFDIMPWDTGSSNIISKLFDLLRTKVFVGDLLYKYNKLWFSCLHQAVVQNTTDDFAFKTTYVKLKVSHPMLLNRDTYESYDITPVEDFFSDIKPFHTKLHTSVRSVDHTEANLIEVEETERNTYIEMRYNDHSFREWEGDIVLLGGDFSSISLGVGNTDSMEFTTIDNDIEYIYNGNNFDQPHEEGWGDELYPVDYTENISILVQTNNVSLIENPNTRSFRINMYMPQNIQRSTVIEDNKKTTTTANILATDTTVPVDAVNLANFADYGVAWIGSERIEYNAKDSDNLLFVQRGTLGTPAQDHDSGSVVAEANSRIPTLDRFAHYEDNLRLAYNDSGVSLADPAGGITPEHAFIRNAGQGSI